MRFITFKFPYINNLNFYLISKMEDSNLNKIKLPISSLIYSLLTVALIKYLTSLKIHED